VSPITGFPIDIHAIAEVLFDIASDNYLIYAVLDNNVGDTTKQRNYWALSYLCTKAMKASRTEMLKISSDPKFVKGVWWETSELMWYMLWETQAMSEQNALVLAGSTLVPNNSICRQAVIDFMIAANNHRVECKSFLGSWGGFAGRYDGKGDG
jgi:hypothetical protein